MNVTRKQSPRPRMFVYVEKAIASSVQQNKSIVYKLTVRKVREFNGVIRNHKDKTEKRLWEFGKRLNFNESISSIVFRMVLIASGLFFVWRQGRFSENSGGDSRKMFNKKRTLYIYLRDLVLQENCTL